MVTATVRDDGSSRFRDHWAVFPSFAFAWRMNEENMFKKINWLSDLKLRLSWGMTGQQEGIGDYNYFAVYEMNTGVGSYYPVYGDGTLARPKAYDPSRKLQLHITLDLIGESSNNVLVVQLIGIIVRRMIC